MPSDDYDEYYSDSPAPSNVATPKSLGSSSSYSPRTASSAGRGARQSLSPRPPPSEASSEYSSLPTPSGYSSSEPGFTPRQGALPTTLLATAGVARMALMAADNAFSWLTEPREHDERARVRGSVPPPPPPEQLVRFARAEVAAPTYARPYGEPLTPDGAMVEQRPPRMPHGLDGVGRRGGAKLEWKEIDELRLALGENETAVQRLSLDLASRAVEEQAIVEQGEELVAHRQSALRALRERVDAMPQERAARLAELHAAVHAASAALEEAKAAEVMGREAKAEEERILWEGSEQVRHLPTSPHISPHLPHLPHLPTCHSLSCSDLL